ncbi:hypothetical protein KGM_205711 [Danaus plexippus plexippus]|uniref:Uncharacterized protein n=1 Tax=Danaus plexippus plexippus TaxID=278856 RepID=A0A212FEM0_DANPL|nr:hypothetical protein KGM_205711 [Danaus plexippus plexippus]
MSWRAWRDSTLHVHVALEDATSEDTASQETVVADGGRLRSDRGQRLGEERDLTADMATNITDPFMVALPFTRSLDNSPDICDQDLRLPPPGHGGRHDTATHARMVSRHGTPRGCMVRVVWGRVGSVSERRRSALVLEPSVDGLHIREDALPVRLPHGDHVVHVQERVDARLLTGTRYDARLTYTYMTESTRY